MDNFDLKKHLVENKLTKNSRLNEDKEGFVITNGNEWYAGAEGYLKFTKYKSQSNLYPTEEKAKKALSLIPNNIIKEKNLEVK
jgi:hypothetical protein